MKPRQDDHAVIKRAAAELEDIFSDSVKYPQLKMPDRQQERVKNLMFDLREHLSRHQFRTEP